MGKGKNAYVVCAKLQGADTPCSELGEVMAGQPAIRRLNRMERVALSFDGELARRARGSAHVVRGQPANTVAACSSAAALRRTAQLSGNRLTLKIGIHKAAPQTCFTTLQPVSASGPRAERRDHKRRSGFDTAGRLAGFASEDSVIVSTLVFEALDPEIRKIGQPLRDESTNVGARAQLAFRAGAPDEALTLRTKRSTRQPAPYPALWRKKRLGLIDRIPSPPSAATPAATSRYPTDLPRASTRSLKSGRRAAY